MSTSTDFQTLGRLGTASGTLTGGTLRRRSTLRGGRTVRRGRPYTGGGLPSLRLVLAAAGIVLLALFLLGLTARSQLGSPMPSASSIPSMDPVLEASLAAGGTQTAATGSRILIPGGGATADLVEVPPAFGAVEDVALSLPSRQHQGVVFGEADTVDALPMAPVGTMEANDNPAGFEPARQLDGPAYRVQAPLTGVRPATGMARILLLPGSEVLAPVTGQVVAVEEHSTGDGGRDWRVVLQPATRPDLHVVLRQVADPQVAVGDAVGIGQTVLGTVRPIPAADLANAVDDVNPLGLPSVLLSVRPGTVEDLVVDPHAPAVAAAASAG